MLFVGVGPLWAVAINAASYLVAIPLWRFQVEILRTPTTHDPTAIRRMFSGLAVIRRRPVLLMCLVTACTINFFSAAITTAEVFFVRQSLGAPAAALGWLGGAFAAGMLVGIAVFEPLQKLVGLRTFFAIAVSLIGPSIIALSFARSVWWAAAGFVLVGVVLSLVNTSLGPIVMNDTPPEYLGRVYTTLGAGQSVLSVLGPVVAAAVLGGLGAGVVHVIVPWDSASGLYLFSALGICAVGVWVVGRTRRPPAEVPAQSSRLSN